jgi:hypothetical protein
MEPVGEMPGKRGSDALRLIEQQIRGWWRRTTAEPDQQVPQSAVSFADNSGFWIEMV